MAKLSRSIGFVPLVCVMLLAPVASANGPSTRLLTYGPQAATAEGDDDHRQEIFIHIPAGYSDKLYLRLFDADCGGVHDQQLGEFDTSTRFALFAEAFSSEVTVTDPEAGTLVKELVLAADAALDNEWHALAEILPQDPEQAPAARVLRLLVEGVAGDDGNIFAVAISTSPRRNRPANGVRLLSYGPTIRINDGAVAEMRLQIPAQCDQIVASSFDAGGARITFDSHLRSLEISPSGQDSWQQSSLELDDEEAGEMAALTFGGGGAEIPNDASFRVTDGDGQPLAIELPIRAGRRNTRPAVQFSSDPLADCFSFVLDGSSTSDDDGDLLQFAWDLGDGATAKGQRVVHRYSAPGTYQGRLIVTDSSGTLGNGTAHTFTIVVNQAPQSEAGPDLVGVPGHEIVFDGAASSDPDGTIRRYLWDFADGATGTTQTARHAFGDPGKYIVSLRVEDDSASPCNFASDFLTVWVNYPPVAAAGRDQVCSVGETITLDGRSSYDTDGEITSYEWDFGDGSSGQGNRLEHTFSEPGSYQVTIRVADDAGAANSLAEDQLFVVVNDPPLAAAGVDRRVALGEVTIFDGSSSLDRDGKIVAYDWNFGDGGSGQGRVTPYAYSAPGTYTATLTVRDSSPAEGLASDTVTVVVNARPVARAGNDRVVTSSAVAFDGATSSDPDGSVLDYLWDFGDGHTSSGATPDHVYARPGMYPVTLKVTDDSGTPLNESIDRLTVVVNERPMADAGPDQIAAPGEAVRFLAFDSFDPDGEVVEFLWDFADGSNGSGQSVAHTFARPGIYPVRLKVLDDTGDPNARDFDQAVVRVNSPPTAEAGPDRLVAPGQELSFSGSDSFDIDGELTTYRWRFSDGNGAAEALTTSRSFAEPGIYAAHLTVIDNSGASNDIAADELMIRVNHQPRAVPGPDVISCSSALDFDGSSSVDPDGDALTYSWDFGDGETANGVVVTHIFAAGGTFPVTLTVDDGTGLANARHAAAMEASINRRPVAEAGDDFTACAGKVALFDGSASVDPEGGLLRYRWDLGDGSNFEGVHPTRIYTTGGVYTVRLDIEDDSGLQCSGDSDQLTVTVVESPVADAGADLTVCAHSRVAFDGTGSRDFDGVVNRYEWDFGDGGRASGATSEHIFTTPGTYQVQLTVTGDQVGSCDNTDNDETAVTVLTSPVARIAAAERVPVATATTFDGAESSGEGASIVAWAWDFGDGSSATGERVNHSFASPGRYTTTLSITTDTAVTCSTVSTQKTVIVNQAPVAASGGDRLVGVNQEVVFDGSQSSDSDGAIVDYRWDFGDGTGATGVVVRHRYPSSGRYHAVLAVSDDVDLANSTVEEPFVVTVNAAPTPVITVADTACTDHEVAFSAADSGDSDGEIVSYQWNFGDGTRAQGVAAEHSFARPGRYHVTLTVADGSGVNNSQRQAALTLPVNHPPSAQAGPDVVACAGQEVVLDGTGSADPDGQLVHFLWRCGDGSELAGERVSHSYDQAGTYQATLTVTDDLGTSCGLASDTAQVRINQPPVAVAGADRTAHVGGAHDAVLFDGTASNDGDGDPLTYHWDFGDGSSDTGATVFHGYGQPGEYTVRLRVADGSGVSCGAAEDQLTVTVKARE